MIVTYGLIYPVEEEGEWRGEKKEWNTKWL